MNIKATLNDIQAKEFFTPLNDVLRTCGQKVVIRFLKEKKILIKVYSEKKILFNISIIKTVFLIYLI